MKKLFWFCGGYPSLDASNEIIAAYMAGGCDGIEWTIPPNNPYKEQEHLQDRVRKARQNCSDYKKHLEQISNFKKKYPQAEVFPAVYEETVQEIGVDPLAHFCKDNDITALFLIGDFDEALIQSMKRYKLNLAISVTYYFTEEEIQRVKQNSGFVYLQAFPYKAEIEAGFNTERLQFCITSLRKMGISRPIYCAKGIKKPQDIKLISDAGADGYILGSNLMDLFDNLQVLTDEVKKYPK
jgi:tryptophan synthase alpha chain